MSISKELRDAIDRIDKMHDREKADMKAYIGDWCQELGWSDDSSISKHAKTIEKELRSELETQLDKLFYTKIPRKIRRAIYKSNSGGDALKNIENKMSVKTLVVVALALTSAGYVAHKLQQRQPLRTASLEPSRSVLTPHNTWKLVLVINAKHQDLLDRIKEEGLSSIDQEELMKATQYLWMGTEQDLKANTKLTQWLNGDVVRESNSSEYDVHLVEILLNKHEDGLHVGASQLQRLDAFKQVVKHHEIVRITKRLPSEAFANTGVYEL